MNVVHAGLDLLKEEAMRIEGDVGKAFTELMEDIIEASEIAINILNDLLNYENIDAGNLSDN